MMVGLVFTSGAGISLLGPIFGAKRTAYARERASSSGNMSKHFVH